MIFDERNMAAGGMTVPPKLDELMPEPSDTVHLAQELLNAVDTKDPQALADALEALFLSFSSKGPEA